MAEKKNLEGRKVRLADFPGQEFTLTYAGWDDQWIVKNSAWEDMLRASGDEVISYLIEPYSEPLPPVPYGFYSMIEGVVGGYSAEFNLRACNSEAECSQRLWDRMGRRPFYAIQICDTYLHECIDGYITHEQLKRLFGRIVS